MFAYLHDILQVHDAEKDLEAAQEKLNLQGLRMLSVFAQSQVSIIIMIRISYTC